ncbi:SNX18 protein, partial [Cnemophilus loriae]|nr:SNX18 protein [Cnemophilus loriae]
MALRARALYDFRSENPGEISLREHEVLSLCSEQDIEGWLEGINSHGDRGLFPASYVQVIRAAETPPPARYANLPAGGFEPLPPSAAFKPATLEAPPAAAPEPFSLPPAAAGYPFLPPPYGGSYQPSQGSDDDWDDDWDESSAVADEPGSLSSSYPVYEAAGRRASGHYRLSMQSEMSLSSRSDHLAGHLHPPSSSTKSSATVSRNLNRFSTFVKSGGEAFVLGEVSGFVKDGDKLCVVLGPRGPEWQENPYPFQCSIEDPTKQTKFKGMKSYIAYKLAEKDEMVGANFFLTISVPTGSGAGLDLHEVESQVDGFKAFMKKMDESALQLNHTANEFARKQVTGFKKEYQKVGHSFKCLSQAFELDQQAFSAGLNQAIAFTAEAYDAIGDLFADQPRQDLNAVMDLLALYQGHLANFPDIIHVQKG